MENWEFGAFGIYNFSVKGKFDEYFKNIKSRLDVNGDVCEIGVYKGSSILATAIYLKELGSKKKVYGFDSFSGFPKYHPYDDLKTFKKLSVDGKITKSHYAKVLKNIKYREISTSKTITVENISNSGDFSNNSIEVLQNKIAFLKLNNIVLVKGSFQNTFLEKTYSKLKFSNVLIDCDLYEGYKMAFDFVWEKMVKNSYMFLDEYYSLKFPGAKIATDEFFAAKIQKPKMHKVEKNEFERWYVKKG